ncbi:hypothetical protein [Methylomonas sp. ZR1]|uniref:hypothetical protein n=1 Tax=Methylomonas sp. ZR1 TaxID=1797072 RepID=UPI0014921C98|nr:hypothetical protein [Methylomonas sp. ZR1]
MRKPTFSKSAVWAFSAIMCLAACTPPNTAQRISAFATATTDVSENVADAFKQVNQAYIATATDEAVGIISQGGKVDPKAVSKPFLDNDQYEARAAVLRVLADYAGLLAEIMGDTPQQNLDAEVDKFAAALNSLSSSSDLQNLLGVSSPLTKNDVGILATGINEIARLFIDYKRTKETKVIIRDADASIARITTLLQKDIGAKREVSGLRSQLYAAYDKRLADRFIWISRQSKPGKTTTNGFSSVEQRAEVVAWLDLVKDQEQADHTLERIYKSLGTLRAAHGKLLTAYDDDAPELDSLIGLLKSEAERVSARYKSLKK